jgi:hypothetical protein
VTDPSSPDYPPGLEPSGSYAHAPSGYPIRKAVVSFREGDKVQVAQPHGFNDKPVVLHDGKNMFAEIALLEMFRNADWSAVWVSAWKRAVISDWHPAFCRDCQPEGFVNPQVEEALRGTPAGRLLEAIETARGELLADADVSLSRYSGCWDVIAWKGNDFLIYEAKRGRKRDAINKNQEDWMNLARSSSLPPELRIADDQFVVAEWDMPQRRPKASGQPCKRCQENGAMP